MTLFARKEELNWPTFLGEAVVLDVFGGGGGSRDGGADTFVSCIVVFDSFCMAMRSSTSRRCSKRLSSSEDSEVILTISVESCDP